MQGLFSHYESLGTKEFRTRALFFVSAVAAAIVLVLLVWVARYVLLLLFAGCIGALVLSTLTNWVKLKFHIRRGLAYALVLLGILALIVIGICLRGPALVHQIAGLEQGIPTAIGKILDRLQSQDWGRWLLSQTSGSDKISRGLAFIGSRIGGAMYLTGATIGGLFLVVISSLYLASEPSLYLEGIERILSPSVREVFKACLKEAGQTLKSWLLAKAVSMMTVGAFVGIALLILRIPLAGTLGLIAGILTFIPNVGPILSVFPAALLAFGISPGKGILTILIFCLAHFFEGNLITPLAERKIASLPPALTLTVQLLLGSVTGALGVALAAPITAVFLSVTRVLLKLKTNEAGGPNLEITAVPDSPSYPLPPAVGDR
jgi:predicted PurR-regulated permease PerM